jgi:hypothetical protein
MLGGSFFVIGGASHGLYGTSSVTILTTDAYVFPIGDYVQSHFYYVNLLGTIAGQSYGSCGNKCIATIYPQGGGLGDSPWTIDPPYALVSGSKTNWKIFLTDERGMSVSNFNHGENPQINLHMLQQFIEGDGPKAAYSKPVVLPSRVAADAEAAGFKRVVRDSEGNLEPMKRRRVGKNFTLETQSRG